MLNRHNKVSVENPKTWDAPTDTSQILCHEHDLMDKTEYIIVLRSAFTGIRSFVTGLVVGPVFTGGRAHMLRSTPTQVLLLTKAERRREMCFVVLSASRLAAFIVFLPTNDSHCTPT